MWPLWDVLLGLWALGNRGVVLRNTTLSVPAGRRRTREQILCANAGANRIAATVENAIHAVQAEVFLVDSSHLHGLASSFSDLRCLWVIHHGKGGGYPVAGETETAKLRNRGPPMECHTPLRVYRPPQRSVVGAPENLSGYASGPWPTCRPCLVASAIP